jgi:Protein of unknown function (DUF3617)
VRAASVVLALLVASGCGTEPEAGNQAAQIAIEPGEWESASEIVNVSAPELPHEIRRRMIGPRPVARGCITAAQAPRMIGGSGACNYRGLSLADGRLAGTLICPDPVLLRPTIATIEGRYGPSSYAFDMVMQAALPDGGTMRIEIRGRGRRLGDCPAAAPAATRKGQG